MNYKEWFCQESSPIGILSANEHKRHWSWTIQPCELMHNGLYSFMQVLLEDVQPSAMSFVESKWIYNGTCSQKILGKEADHPADTKMLNRGSSNDLDMKSLCNWDPVADQISMEHHTCHSVVKPPARPIFEADYRDRNVTCFLQITTISCCISTLGCCLS